MTEKENKKPELVLSPREELEPGNLPVPVRARSRRPESKRLRKINPMGMRVVVEIAHDSNLTDGGLYLPEGARQNMMESLLVVVVEVASVLDGDSEEETNISGIPLGSLVLIPKHAGTKVPWDENLRIVETKEVLAIVNEYSLS